MLNQAQHRVIMIEILKDVYSDPELQTVLGFKGGTAAMLFYDLPRFSVDLDFDLLKKDQQQLVVAKINKILEKHGEVREVTEKRFTLFFLLRYKKSQQNIKVEISKRPSKSQFVSKNYLGITMLVMKQEDMLANKLAALLTRNQLAMRDVFDLWFFLNQKWPINDQVFSKVTKLTLAEGVDQAIKKIQPIKQNQIMQGLGELVDEKQKHWVRENLVKETIFYLKLLKETID